MNTNTFKENLRLARETKGMTQGDLAQMILAQRLQVDSMSQKSRPVSLFGIKEKISRWERGISKPRPQSCVLLEQILGVKLGGWRDGS